MGCERRKEVGLGQKGCSLIDTKGKLEEMKTGGKKTSL